MLKLIALKPLSGCRPSALKCLQEDRMYYLCNDYLISEDEISLKDEYVRPLPQDFFSLSNNSHLSINISAVVGMNGDGKSTLIELMMRLINNCAKHYRLTYKDKLLRIEGIKAELYYLLDDTIYCIRETANDKFTSLLKCASLTDNGEGRWKKMMIPVKSVKSMNELFYTLISNYSLYAYNINDFNEEWNDKIQTDDEREKCWLHHLFHKNDGYRTPMTIHPYRDKGNIDINRENDLTRQRLIALYIQEPDATKDPHSFRKIGEKYADDLLLTDIGYSKLQEKTIVQYFKEVKTVSILKGTIREIESLIVIYDDLSGENLMDNSLEAIEPSLDFLTGANDPDYRKFLVSFSEWASVRRKIYSSNSDVRLLLNAMRKFNNNNLPALLPHERFARKYKSLDKLNVKQLTRLRLIYEVTKRLGLSSEVIFKKYEDLTDIERCWHYIVYKTINICETYPKYIEIVDTKGKGWYNFPLPSDAEAISEALARINDDRSHVTLKLNQCLNFIAALREKPDFILSIAKKKDEDGLNPDKTNPLRISFEKLKKHYRQPDSFPLELLPPPIFDGEIRYRSTLNEDANITYKYLSSGEKQLLNNVGVLLYHLRNLDSVVDGEAKCRNVNIILEEIELYFHPEYQRMIIKTLIEKLHGANFRNIENINITFVTHSPFILSDIPMCNVLLLKDGRPSTQGMQENTFGANIHGMLKNGFFLPSLPVGEFAHDKINHLFDRLNRFKLDSRSRKEREWFYSNIMRIGEPYLREQLMKLFQMHFPQEYHD